MKSLALVALMLVSCGKQEAPSSESLAPSASASAAPRSEPEKPSEKPATASTFKGSYAAKQAEVRTPEDAPKFIHPESKDGVGAGELELTLPEKYGVVTGKASGALGSQLFSGWLEDGRLTGTLHPESGASPMMWGLVDAAVEGTNVKGTIRASGGDGRVVREAAFDLKK